MNQDPDCDIKTIAAIEWRRENIGRVREKTRDAQVGIYTSYADSDQQETARLFYAAALHAVTEARGYD